MLTKFTVVSSVKVYSNQNTDHYNGCFDKHTLVNTTVLVFDEGLLLLLFFEDNILLGSRSSVTNKGT